MSGDRYEFGVNWRRFLETVDEESILSSIAGLRRVLRLDSLEGRSFIDVGCGSGLSSLAASRLGAERIVSFDYDADSVEAAKELRDRGEFSCRRWEIHQGDVLQSGFLADLGRFDVVYSWGVLHHTGRMWEAVRETTSLVEQDGLLVLGIYNKKSPHSEIWRSLKRLYCRGGPIRRAGIRYAYLGAMAAYRLVRLELHRGPYKQKRGMDYWRDLDDWLGGYPFEFASPEEVVRFTHELGFELISSLTGKSVETVNEFLFRRCDRAIAAREMPMSDAGLDAGPMIDP